MRCIETVEFLTRNGRYEDATDLLSTFTEEEQNQEGGTYYRGFFALEDGDTKKAIEILSPVANSILTIHISPVFSERHIFWKESPRKH